MKLTVYIDVLLTVNIIVNYFLLKTAALTVHIPHNQKRIVLSAVVGAAFSLFIFRDDINIILSASVKLISVIVCCIIAFGFRSFGFFVRSLLCLGRANAMLAGIFTLLFQYSDRVYANNLFWYINISPVTLVLCITGIYLMLSIYDLFTDTKIRNEKFSFEILIGEKKKVLSGFYDTGFGVKDIIGRKAVVLCRLSEISDIVEPDVYNAVSDFMTDNEMTDRRITPIFYSDISSAGMLPAIKRDRVKYIGKVKSAEIDNVLIALTDKNLSSDVQLIFGKEIYNMIGEYI